MLLTDNGKLGIGTQTPYSKLSVVPGTSGRQIAIGDWTDFSGSWSGYGLFGGNMYQDTSFTGLRYSNTHGFIGAVGFAVNYPNWNQATIVSSGTTSSTAGASFTPIIIATFDYTGKVGIGTSTPNAKLHISGPSSGFGSGLKITSTDVGGKTFSFYASLSTLIIGDETVGSARLAIDTNGKIGIGTTTPSTNLHVVGDVALTGSGNITNSGNITATGTISGGNVIAKYQDVAEWVPARNAMSAGTVVTLDPEHSNLVVASSRSYDTRVAGVVSEKPGVILGEGGQGKVMVATTGRVRVKVDATNGPIRVGDLLVTSDKEGIAMRSQPLDLGDTPIHRPGTLIGKALEPLEKGVGEILVLLSLQ